MAIISALILTLSILFGGLAQATDAAPTQALTAPTQATCEEDMDCWDAQAMGNGQHDTLKVDAWETIDTANIHAPEDSPNLMLSYTESTSGQPANLPQGYFALSSNTMPNVYHIFRWDILMDV